MVNPEMIAPMFGVSPQVMQQAQQIGQVLRMEIRKYRQQGKLEVTYIPLQEGVNLSSLIDQMAEQMGSLHRSLFGIEGVIRNME